MTELYSEWRDFYAKRVNSWMSLEELRAECGKLTTADGTSPELLLIHAMHALEEYVQRNEALRAEVERLRGTLANPATTHCDNCGCDWLDNGLNPVGCPYCKQSEYEYTIAALRERLGGKA